VRSDLVVVFLVRCENVAKMALDNDDDVIRTFPSDRADQPLRISALRWAVTLSHRSSRRDCRRMRSPYRSPNEIVGTTNMA
jgi:hypothetical protein